MVGNGDRLLKSSTEKTGRARTREKKEIRGKRELFREKGEKKKGGGLGNPERAADCDRLDANLVDSTATPKGGEK